MEDVKDPETCNVFALYRHFASPDEVAALAEKYRAGGMGYGDAKQALFEAYEAFIGDKRARFEELLENREEIDAVLAEGAKKARVVAERVLDRVRTRCGFRR